MEYQTYYCLILFRLIKKESEANIMFDYSMMENAKRIIEEGATMIRVGTGIFGERNYNK